MKIETNLLEKITKKAQEDNTNTNTINTVKNIWDNPLTKVAVGVVGVGALALVTRGAVRNNASKRVAGLRDVLAKYQDDLARVKTEMEIPTNNRCYKRRLDNAEEWLADAKKYDDNASALRKKYFEKYNELKNAKLIDKTEPVYTHGDIYWKGYRETYEEFMKRKDRLAKELADIEKQVAKNEEAAIRARRLADCERTEADKLWSSVLEQNHILEKEAGEISCMINSLNEQITKLTNRYKLA